MGFLIIPSNPSNVVVGVICFPLGGAIPSLTFRLYLREEKPMGVVMRPYFYSLKLAIVAGGEVLVTHRNTNALRDHVALHTYYDISPYQAYNKLDYYY